MPLFFNLYRKGAPEGSAPVSAIALDTEICALFGAEPDQHYYFAGWFDSIGLRLAQRQTWDEIRAKFTEARAAAIAGGDLEYAEVSHHAASGRRLAALAGSIASGSAGEARGAGGGKGRELAAPRLRSEHLGGQPRRE